MPALEAASQIKVVRDALLLIGEHEIQSLTEDGHAVAVANARFHQVYENLLSPAFARWRFSVTKAVLSQLVTGPINEWQYAYQLPGDLIACVKVYPNGRFARFGDQIYSNASALSLDYQYKPEVGDLPPYFALLLTYYCAFEWSRPVTEGASRKTELGQMFDRQLNVARFTDATQYPNDPWSDSPFTLGREDWR